MSPSKYDALGDANRKALEEERKRQAALESKKEKARDDLKQKNAHGYQTLSEAHERAARTLQAEAQLGSNAGGMTKLAYGQDDKTKAQPAQIERPALPGRAETAQPQGRSGGNVQLAPGGTMFTAAPQKFKVPQTQGQEQQQSQDKARADYHAQRRETQKFSVRKDGRTEGPEMTEARQRQENKFKINLTEKQKEQLQNASLAMGRNDGMGGR